MIRKSSSGALLVFCSMILGCGGGAGTASGGGGTASLAGGAGLGGAVPGGNGGTTQGPGGASSSRGGSPANGGASSPDAGGSGGAQGCAGVSCNSSPAGLLDANRTTNWNPGILSDDQLHLPSATTDFRCGPRFAPAPSPARISTRPSRRAPRAKLSHWRRARTRSQPR